MDLVNRFSALGPLHNVLYVLLGDPMQETLKPMACETAQTTAVIVGQLRRAVPIERFLLSQLQILVLIAFRSLSW